ncbi:MAG: hypothetical protein ACRDWI_09805 [Jiangellaceae bacterium]
MTTVLSDVVRTVRAWPIFGFYIAATLVVATIIGLITVNVIDLGMQHFGEASHRTHDVAYGALFTTLVLGVLVQLRRPEHNVAGMVMALVPSASLLLAAVLVDDIDRVFEFNPLRYAAAVAAVTALLHPSGRAFFRSFQLSAISWPMVALVGVAAVPLLGFVSTNVRLQRDAMDMHVFMGHYGFMAALAYTIIGVGLLASLRPVGWRLTAWVAAGLAAVLGGTSLLYPDAASSLATGWALAAIAWAAAFVVLSLRTEDAHHRITMAGPDAASDAHGLARVQLSR